MEKEDQLNMEEFRKIMAKVTADEKTFVELIRAQETNDTKFIKDYLDRLELPPHICRLFCRWICWLECTPRCMRLCQIVCY